MKKESSGATHAKRERERNGFQLISSWEIKGIPFPLSNLSPLSILNHINSKVGGFFSPVKDALD